MVEEPASQRTETTVSSVSGYAELSSAATGTGRFLKNWFDRLAESGWTAEVFLGALSEDLVWTATGTSPISGTYRGLTAYVDGIYKPLDERLESWPRPSVERIVADGEWGVVEFSSTGGRGTNGTDYNMRYCWVIHVQQGLVTEVTGYYDTRTVCALFADEAEPIAVKG
jgi:hypothetical protein